MIAITSTDTPYTRARPLIAELLMSLARMLGSAVGLITGLAGTGLLIHLAVTGQ